MSRLPDYLLNKFRQNVSGVMALCKFGHFERQQDNLKTVRARGLKLLFSFFKFLCKFGISSRLLLGPSMCWGA